MPDIVNQDLDGGESLLISIALPGGLDAAEPDSGPAVRLFWRQTLANAFVGEPLDVGLEFLGQIAVGLPAQKRADETRPAAAELRASRFGTFERHEPADDFRRLGPLRLLGGQLFPSNSSDAVEPGAAVVLGHAPLGRDRALPARA